jgi:hypothetical protein
MFQQGVAIEMTANLPETTSKMEGPLVKQFSVFLPNKVGAMLDVVKLLSTQSTHAVALSVSESTDSAIARIIASDPARVEKLFREKNVPFGVCEVVVVEIREVATQLVKTACRAGYGRGECPFRLSPAHSSAWLCRDCSARGRYRMCIHRTDGRRIQNAEPG